MPKPKPKHFRILVADDDKRLLKVFQKTLARVHTGPTAHPEADTFKFDLVLCRQADEAVQAVKKSIEQDRTISLAFMDVRMPPGPDGVSAAEQIRPWTPISKS